VLFFSYQDGCQERLLGLVETILGSISRLQGMTHAKPLMGVLGLFSAASWASVVLPRKSRGLDSAHPTPLLWNRKEWNCNRSITASELVLRIMHFFFSKLSSRRVSFSCSWCMAGAAP